MERNFLDIRLFGLSVSGRCGGKDLEHNDEWLSHTKKYYVHCTCITWCKWLSVIALTGKAIFVGIGNSYRPMEKLIMKLNMT